MSYTLSIPKPCPQDWDAMTPASGGRHCAVCDKVVVDLCGMSVSGARKLIEERTARGESVCGRAGHLPNGRVSLGRRYVLTNGLALILAAAASSMAADQAAPPAVQPEPAPAVRGAIVMGRMVCGPALVQVTDAKTDTTVTVNGDQLGAIRAGKNLWNWQPAKGAPAPGKVTALKLVDGRLHVERTTPAGTTITIHNLDTGVIQPPST